MQTPSSNTGTGQDQTGHEVYPLGGERVIESEYKILKIRIPPCKRCGGVLVPKEGGVGWERGD